MSIRVEVHASLPELAHYAERWDGLVAASPQRLPMLSHAWVAAHLEHCLGPGDRWLCALALRDDRLVGVLPVLVQPDPLWRNRLPRLSTIGGEHTRSGDAVLDDGERREVLDALLQALLAGEPHAGGLLLREVHEASPTLAAVAQTDAGLSVRQRQRSRGSYLRTAGSFDEYFGNLSRNFRGNLRKARNKLVRLPEVEDVFLGGADADESGLDRFLRLEASGWKGSSWTAISEVPALERFYRSLVRNLADRGWLEWHELRVAGKPIAAHLAVRVADTVSLVKIAYDEEYSRSGPGNMLLERYLAHAFADDDIREVNCLTDQPWHRNWQMSRAAYRSVWVFPRRTAALAYARPASVVSDVGRDAARAVYRRLPPRVQPRVDRLLRRRRRARGR